MNNSDHGLEKMIGNICWGLHWSKQLNLSMSFGEPRREVAEEFLKTRLGPRRPVSVKGKWWLWIFMSYWRIVDNGETIATSGSSSGKIHNSFFRLNGHKLEKIQIKPDSFRTLFYFDLGYILDARRMEPDTDEEMWSIYQPDDICISLKSNGTLEREQYIENETKTTIIGTAADGICI